MNSVKNCLFGNQPLQLQVSTTKGCHIGRLLKRSPENPGTPKKGGFSFGFPFETIPHERHAHVRVWLSESSVYPS